MKSMLRLASALVLVLSLGLHWGLLQTVAWTGMVISYARDASLETAIAKTFDGDHPCCLCKAIKQGRDEEKKQEAKEKPGSKLDSGLVWSAADLDFACDRERVVFLEPATRTFDLTPPKPRPRCLS